MCLPCGLLCSSAQVLSTLADISSKSVRVDGSASEVVVSNTGALQGTVLAPFLFTTYNSEVCFNSGSCHLQKFSDDSSIVICIVMDNEEYRELIESFVTWRINNHLKLNISKTKALEVDYQSRLSSREKKWRGWTHTSTLGSKSIKLNWSHNTDTLFRKAQSRLFFLKRLRSFSMCNRLLKILDSAVTPMSLYLVILSPNALV